jgi:hypothetical protein
MPATDESENHPHQKADQRDDGQRLRAALLDQKKKIHCAEAYLHAEKSDKRKAHLANEFEHFSERQAGADGRIAYLLEKRCFCRLFASPLFFRHRFGQVE